MRDTVALGEVCAIEARLVDPTSSEYAALPHVGPENIDSGAGRLLAVRTAAEDGMTSGKYLFEAGDILYSKIRPYLRKAAVAPFDGLCSADVYPLRVGSAIADPQYLLWLLLSEGFTRYANECSGRARMPKLNREQLLSWRTVLPSLADQRRIAACLTEQLAAVEGARGAAQEMVTAAATLRAGQVRSALATGESGEWPRRRLGEICHIQLGKMLSPKSKTGSEPRKYLRNANVQWDRFQLVDVAEMDFTEGEREKFELQRGDLLVCEGGEPGRSAVWQAEIEPCFYQKALHRLRPRVEGVNPRFLMYRMCLGAASGEFSGSHAKTTIAHLPAVRLAELEIGLPSIETQSAMVRALDEGAEVCRRLESQALSELAAISALPAALMREAFNSAG